MIIQGFKMYSKDEEVTIKGLEDYKVDSDEEDYPNQRVKFSVSVILPRISTIHQNWFRQSSDTSIQSPPFIKISYAAVVFLLIL